MALPVSGPITLKQISTEFSASNTIKSCATAASLSTSNIKLKDFYGLSSAIDPVYIQPFPTTQADVDAWTNEAAGTSLTDYGDAMRARDSEEANKLVITTPVVLISRALVCTPSVQYTISYNIGGSGRESGLFRVYDKTEWDTNGSLGTYLSTKTLPNTGTSAQSFTFTAPNADIVIAARFEGAPTTTTDGSSVTMLLDSIRVEL